MKKGKIYLILAIAGLIACAVLMTITAVNALNDTERSAEAAASVIIDAPVSTSVSGTVATDSILDTGSLFTERDMEQSADLTNAQYITVSDGEEITVSEEGVYVISGTASDAMIIVNASDSDKVQLVLDSLNMENNSRPCIFVSDADKVFITIASDSSLSVTGEFEEYNDTNTDGVIYSKKDLVLNGTAELTVKSSDIGIVCKDDLKITGGTYNITAGTKAIEGKDSIRIADGTFILQGGSDGLHAENKDDDTKGYIYIGGGTFTINAQDDAIHAISVIQIDEGTFDINAAEGLEGTYIQINSGEIFIHASDDGINAGRKSNSWYPTIEINSGTLTVETDPGDTDGIDSNGDIIINGGVINVTAASAFDCDGTAQYHSGTVIINGQEVNSIPLQMGGKRGR